MTPSNSDVRVEKTFPNMGSRRPGLFRPFPTTINNFQFHHSLSSFSNKQWFFIKSPAARLAAATILMSLLFAVSHGFYGGLVGGRRPVEDVKTNKQAQELGRFSVAEYNRMQRQSLRSNGGGELLFKEVVEAETQVVSGVKYYLKISTVRSGVNGVTPMLFDSQVVVKPWLRSKQLLNFAPHNNLIL